MFLDLDEHITEAFSTGGGARRPEAELAADFNRRAWISKRRKNGRSPRANNATPPAVVAQIMAAVATNETSASIAARMGVCAQTVDRIARTVRPPERAARCARPTCGVIFVRRVFRGVRRQTYCSKPCAKAAWEGTQRSVVEVRQEALERLARLAGLRASGLSALEIAAREGLSPSRVWALLAMAKRTQQANHRRDEVIKQTGPQCSA